MVKRDKVKNKRRKKKDKHGDADLAIPPVIVPEENAPAIKTKWGTFDLEEPELPEWVTKRALRSGGFPYDDEMDKGTYEDELERLQVELAKLQLSVNSTGQRIIALFEGRDAAGKGGTIISIRENMNPRLVRDVALPKPTEVERGQWYFQRYVEQFPTKGEIVLFDRSWYNRAGVEPVMGFCTDSECRTFLKQAPELEKMLVEDNIVLFKFYLNIGREMQFKRFHDRRHNPLKIWKLSPIDYAALTKWDEYTKALDAMISATHRRETPWTIVLSNDKRRAHLAVIRAILGAVEYRGKDKSIVGKPDPAILGGPKLLDL
ncbi:MAG TPA: polyphosphate kinase 2 [Rhizomicrobium sp.]|nr:polyphosphate kinase 2 [Rhizomicrobium sp.]